MKKSTKVTSQSMPKGTPAPAPKGALLKTSTVKKAKGGKC